MTSDRYSPRVITISAVRGHVLEELLAELLRASGYELLVDADQDAFALVAGSNGLRVRGRGADHQADVLGQLRLALPFTFPIRLFVEAKYRTGKTSLADVRNAVGVVNDVNEHFSTAAAQAAGLKTRHVYRYALFSASGFTQDAQSYALAHQLSLIDLSAPAFEPILQLAARVANALFDLASDVGVDRFPIAQVRDALRRALGTLPGQSRVGDFESLSGAEAAAKKTTSGGLPIDQLARIAAEAADSDLAMYLAFTTTPFIAVLVPDEPADAAVFFGDAREARRNMRIVFAGEDAANGEWALIAQQGDRPVTLRLASAPEIEPWLLAGGPTTDGDDRSRLLTVSVDGNEVELAFDPIQIEGTAPEPWIFARAERQDREFAFRPERRSNLHEASWSRAAIQEFMVRLRLEGPVQARIIEIASRKGGVITRGEVYAHAGFPPDRMLKGFTRPTNRIANGLKSRGLLSNDAQMPLQAEYDGAVAATRFVVPREFVLFFDRR